MMGLLKGYWFARCQASKIRDLWWVRRCYPGFRKYIAVFRSEYRSCNPFHLVRDYFLAKGERENGIYGETPLRTMEALARECAITERDCVFDLGCGRAMALCFISYLTGCKGVGIDLIPTFIEKSKLIHSRISDAPSLLFLCKDYVLCDLTQATCIYLYGTCLEDKRIYELVDVLRELSSSVKIVTVSYPLTDYSQDFTVVKRWKGEFPWGSTELYLNRSKKVI